MRVASPHTFTGVASARILPHDTASSGLAPESLPSNIWAVLMHTEKSAPFFIRLALLMWCFGRPPPRTSMPVFRGAASIASLFMPRMSPTMSRTRPGLRNEWKYSMSPMDPSVRAGQ